MPKFRVWSTIQSRITFITDFPWNKESRNSQTRKRARYFKINNIFSSVNIMGLDYPSTISANKHNWPKPSIQHFRQLLLSARPCRFGLRSSSATNAILFPYSATPLHSYSADVSWSRSGSEIEADKCPTPSCVLKIFEMQRSAFSCPRRCGGDGRKAPGLWGDGLGDAEIGNCTTPIPQLYFIPGPSFSYFARTDSVLLRFS